MEVRPPLHLPLQRSRERPRLAGLDRRGVPRHRDVPVRGRDLEARRGLAFADEGHGTVAQMPGLDLRAGAVGRLVPVLGDHLAGEQEDVVAEVVVLDIVDPEDAGHAHLGELAQAEVERPELVALQPIGDGVAEVLHHLVVGGEGRVLVERAVRLQHTHEAGQDLGPVDRAIVGDEQIIRTTDTALRAEPDTRELAGVDNRERPSEQWHGWGSWSGCRPRPSVNRRLGDSHRKRRTTTLTVYEGGRFLDYYDAGRNLRRIGGGVPVGRGS